MAEAGAIERNASRSAALPKAGMVDVWLAPISLDEKEMAALERTLAPGERSHAARLRSAAARARFVVTRAKLRLLLGEYVGCEPQAVELRTCAHGKPELASAGPPALHFNVSHSGDLALLAFASDSPVGVDLERERARSDVTKLSSRFFAPEEHAAIQAAPAAGRLRAFLTIWTAKEALLKARGDGLRGLGDIRVAIGPAGARAVTAGARGSGGGPWSVRTLAPAAGYVGAIAARSLPQTFQARTLSLRPGTAQGSSSSAY